MTNDAPSAKVFDALTFAGWTTKDSINWTGPNGEGPFSWPIALMLADLPRVIHECDPSQFGERGRPATDRTAGAGLLGNQITTFARHRISA